MSTGPTIAGGRAAAAAGPAAGPGDLFGGVADFGPAPGFPPAADWSAPPAVDLRPYQGQCADAVFSGFDAGLTRLLYVLATGCGKTITFAEIIRRRRAQLGSGAPPALVVAHREELLSQARATMLRVMPWARVDEERADQQARRGADVIVASTATIGRAGSKRMEWLARERPSLLIVDEAHHSAAVTYANIFERFGVYSGDTLLVGCTATPHRLDQRELCGPDGEAAFQEEVYRFGMVEAIRGGYLCDVRGFRVVTETSLDAVGSTAGDFNQKQLAAAVDNPARTRSVIARWKEVAEGRKTVVFCVTVEHAEHVAEEFRAAGVPAACVHGGLDSETRRDILAQSKSGTLPVLTNVNVLTEGYDDPELSCIVMMRPTQSWALYTQCVGRGTRLSPGKEYCLVLDAVDVSRRHKLATCPTLVGLSPELDLEGESVTQALALVEKAAGATGKNLPASMKELRSHLEAVDLFGRLAGPPDEVRRFEGARLSWLWTPTGYVLYGGKYPDGTPRVARLTRDALGHWNLATPINDRRARVAGTGPQGDVPDFRQADEIVLAMWPMAANYARLPDPDKPEPVWRGDPISDAQLRSLVARGYPEDRLRLLTKGQASDLINRAGIEAAAGLAPSAPGRAGAR